MGAALVLNSKLVVSTQEWTDNSKAIEDEHTYPTQSQGPITRCPNVG